MLYLNKLWDDRKKMKPFWWIYLFQIKMQPLWQDSFLKTQADIYTCSDYFFQGFSWFCLIKLIWLHYKSIFKKAGTSFFFFSFSVFLFSSFYCMVFVLCSCFSFFILLLHVLSWALLTFLILYFCASRTFSLASLDNVFFGFTW